MGRPKGQSLREWSRRANTRRRAPILHESEILMGRRKRLVRWGAGEESGVLVSQRTTKQKKEVLWGPAGRHP